MPAWLHDLLATATHHRWEWLTYTLAALAGVYGALAISRRLGWSGRPDPATVAGGRARYALPPAPAPAVHLDADDWHPAAEISAVGPGVLNRAALEEPTQAYVAVVPTDEQVDTARWATYWRRVDAKLEAKRRDAGAVLIAFDPNTAALMRDLDDRDTALLAVAERAGLDLAELDLSDIGLLTGAVYAALAATRDRAELVPA